MRCIQNTNTDPCFSLAAEEYILKNFRDDCFMLWRSDNAIVVGKHQNALAEINMDFVRKNKIKVVRRISGGGTVFHDLGNLNFTFIMNGEEGKLVDFRKFTNPILDVLKELGVEGKFEGRNDLTYKGKKFSGNAEHVWRKRTLHHGTILFSSKINDLSLALKVGHAKFIDKAVQSNRSKVTNLSEYLDEKMDVLEFRDRIMKHIMEKYQDCRLYDFDDKDMEAIAVLMKEKFCTWEWNFGYSPRYDFHRTIHTKSGKLEFYIQVEKGIIKEINVIMESLSLATRDLVENALTDVPHNPDRVAAALQKLNFQSYFNSLTLEEFISGMF